MARSLKNVMDRVCEVELAEIKRYMNGDSCHCLNPCNKTAYRMLKKLKKLFLLQYSSLTGYLVTVNVFIFHFFS